MNGTLNQMYSVVVCGRWGWWLPSSGGRRCEESPSGREAAKVTVWRETWEDTDDCPWWFGILVTASSPRAEPPPPAHDFWPFSWFVPLNFLPCSCAPCQVFSRNPPPGKQACLSLPHAVPLKLFCGKGRDGRYLRTKQSSCSPGFLVVCIFFPSRFCCSPVTGWSTPLGCRRFDHGYGYGWLGSFLGGGGMTPHVSRSQ